MKVFFAMPYTQFCDKKTYEVTNEYKVLFERLLSETKLLNCDYFLAHERENWGKNYNSDVESTEIDYNTIIKSDLVISIPGDPISGGVHVEMGWASSAKRKLRIFLKKGVMYSPMITGINVLTDTKYYYYEDFNEKLINQILSVIKEEMD